MSYKSGIGEMVVWEKPIQKCWADIQIMGSKYVCGRSGRWGEIGLCDEHYLEIVGVERVRKET